MNTTKLTLMALVLASAAGAQAQSPAYSIVGNDTTCQIFVFSPGERDGLHVAYQADDESWTDLGQVVSSDYGPWGAEKKMFHPFVAKADDGSWRALWSLNNHAPAFAVAYSEDLITWRPQDYPRVKEKGVDFPVAYQMADGTWDIYLKTAQGKRYVQASDDFRKFQEDTLEASADEVLWQMDTVTVAGKVRTGNLFEVPAVHLHYMMNWMKAMANDQKRFAESMRDDGTRFASLPQKVKAVLRVDNSKVKPISDRLIGVFFEDISRAADGGLYAELVENRDFEYNADDRGHKWNAATAWQLLTMEGKNAQVKDLPLAAISTENGLSANNPHYAVVNQGQALLNRGFGEIKDRGAQYDFTVWAKNIGSEKNQLVVALTDDEGHVLAQARVATQGEGWKQYRVTLDTQGKMRKKAGVTGETVVALSVMVKKKGQVGLDMVSLFPRDTYKGHGLRKDLAEAIAALKPKFVRFPGGCMSHGDGIGNIYHWAETVGPWQDRKPAPNIWRYHQTRGLGFYEYFQWCEDMGAEPLPVLAAGVPCQNSGANAEGLAGQQGGIPMDQMPAYCQEFLDLVEWANGDPATSKWAKMRADAGHPEPFGLKMIGVGNEDLISTDFEERYLMIAKTIKEHYPDIEVVGTVGPFHYPSSDYIEGWKVAKESKWQGKNLFSAMDEHYYESPGWFLHNQDYYDQYDRSAPRVYIGEYASRGRNMENALAEALYLCQVERNGDVVEMTSYAPLLCDKKHANWNPDLIYFDNAGVEITPSYMTQKIFGTHAGDRYVETALEVADSLKYRLGASLVKDSKTGRLYLKLVNALPSTVSLTVDGLAVSNSAVYERFGGSPMGRKMEFSSWNAGGDDANRLRVENNTVELPPYSVVAITL